MKRISQIAVLSGLAALFAAGVYAPKVAAQDPITTLAPVILDETVPIVVNAVKPKPKNTGLAKFQGVVMHANTAQVTVKSIGNDMAIQTFTLSEQASAKMQTIVDKGGYQYGDKITIYYDPQSLKAMRFKGKPSPAL
jgi:hypothetical protein